MNSMEIFFYQAGCGDAARIRYLGNDGKYHNIMIDSGYSRTYSEILTEQLNEIERKKECIDVWIISHIHDDHIEGAVAYINSVKRGERKDIVDTWFYNAPRQPKHKNSKGRDNLISTPASIDNGDKLAEYLNSIGKLNTTDMTTESPNINLYGLSLIVLSPDSHKLRRLREKYPPGSGNRLQRIEDEMTSLVSAARGHDYHKPLEAFALDQWIEDDSVENGSSIAFLINYNDKNVLWLADAHPSLIVESLIKLGYNRKNKLTCEWVKVTHHGSKGNNSNKLYDIVNCSNYLISANGTNRHCLPTKECLARILRNENRPMETEYKLYFTYDDTILRRIFDVDSTIVFKKYNFHTLYLNGQKYLKTTL
ncbi:MBL fold metallo-hydrolase [Olivibacter domesticus]|uniref:Metallo-beta-lactamase superfamily protein n=1 Tax=Olivibacter domesticus TaxID=407022 RepID=A0A1H7ILM3_OLID1|nr:MBL fold metallo-hydrolase [Olivibacter domesticus]SEK62460.1 Metallo-beta-lactamase superfamily protein [Olivibacter domesticus]